MERVLELLGPKCAFCDNKNLNVLAQNYKFRTSTTCGHRICAHCYVDQFKNKKIVECPACGDGHVLKKTELSEKPREELDYLRECDVRRRVLTKFNLERRDFSSDDAFAAYQERGEELVWNLLNRVNVEETKKELERNERDNGESIAMRAAERAERNRTFREMQREAKLEKQHMLHELAARERLEHLLRQRERLEGNKVALGEIKATSREMDMARQELERLEAARTEREQREAQIKAMEGYGPQTMQYEENLWPPHLQEAQPKVDKALMEKEKSAGLLFQVMDLAAVKKVRREAAARDPAAVEKRTAQIMLAGLFPDFSL